MKLLEQRIEDLENKNQKPKMCWELGAHDLIPVIGIFTQSDRMFDDHLAKIKESGEIPFGTIAKDYVHYLPRRLTIVAYNIALFDLLAHAADYFSN